LIDAIPSFETYIMAELLYKRKIENILFFSDFEKRHLFHILLIMCHQRLLKIKNENNWTTKSTKERK